MGRTDEIHYPVIPQNGGHLIEVQLLYQGKPLRAILVLFLGSRRGLRWWWCFSQSSPPAIAITNGGLQHKWISRYSRVNWSTFGAIIIPKIHLCSHFKGEPFYRAESSPVLKHHWWVHLHLGLWGLSKIGLHMVLNICYNKDKAYISNTNYHVLRDGNNGVLRWIAPGTLGIVRMKIFSIFELQTYTLASSARQCYQQDQDC